MLKICEDVDIEEVAEVFGFKPKYDEDTGEIYSYEKIHPINRGVIIKKEQVKKRIKIFGYRNKDEKVWKINPYDSYLDIDTLFDLIQAGVVEKVKELGWLE